MGQYAASLEDIQPRNLSKACSQFLQDLLLIDSSESLLIYTDCGSDNELAHTMLHTAAGLGVNAELFSLDQWPDLDSQTEALRDKIRSGGYHCLCELSEQCFYPSGIWEESVKAGRRVYCVGPVKPDSFIRCIAAPEPTTMRSFGARLRKLLVEANEIEIRSAAGTKISARMHAATAIGNTLASVQPYSLPGRALSKVGLARRSTIWAPDGQLKKTGGSTFMGGQLAFRPIPASLSGVAVIDGYQWPPGELGRILQPLTLEISKGQVVDIGGCTSSSSRLVEWLGNREKKVEHFCIGFNPGAGLDGTLIEAERAFGHLNIGFGRHPYHTDGVMISPEMHLDGDLLLKDHSFQHPGLNTLEQLLRN